MTHPPTPHTDDIAADDDDNYCPICDGAGTCCPLGHCPICDTWYQQPAIPFDPHNPEAIRPAWATFAIVNHAWEHHLQRCGLCLGDGVIPLINNE